jgi:aminopeptidase N
MSSSTPSVCPGRVVRAFASFVLLLASSLALASPAAAVTPASPLAAVPLPEYVAVDPPRLSEYLAHFDALTYERAQAHAQPMTLNEQSYNVRYYSLDLHPNPTTKVLTASVRTVATVTMGPLTTLDLDLDNTHMTVDAVTSASVATTFVQSAGVLTLQLDRAYNTGETVDVTVQYHGTPAAGALGAAFAFTTHSSGPFISSLSEPFDARTWWPCKDDPSDKADSVDVRVSVPSGMITASNGRLVESTDDGVTAFVHWHESHPIATYLVSIASFAYTVVRDWYRPTPADSMEIRFHLFPESVAPTAAVEAKVKTMIAAFAARYGPYPFQDEKYGHAQFLWSGGMENETCTSLGTFGEYTVAHELSHQWWGDAVTCRDFHHIWLNEGFATFSEAQWAESQGGLAAYHTYMNNLAYYGSGTVYVPDLSDARRIFNYNLSYQKGAWVLHMLRHVMGDSAFFAALHSYLAQHYFGNAVTEDLEAACEAASGTSLAKFFQQWVYGEGNPVYQTNTSWGASAGGGYDVSLQLRQTQVGQLFWMPVDVRVTTGSGSYDFVAHDSTAVQVFTFHVPSAPTLVAVDPDQWVLRTLVSVTGVAPSAAASTLELSAPYPNPLRVDAAIAFRTPHAGDVELEVLDAAGRRLTRLQHGVLPEGAHQVRWRGVDDSGRTLAPGVYWLSLRFEGERRVRRVAITN